MSRIKPLIVVMLAAAFLIALTGCTGSTTPAAPPDTKAVKRIGDPYTPSSQPSHIIITVNESGFNPATVTVTQGTSVVWQNSGKKTHQVTFAQNMTSGAIKPGNNATHVFSTPGTYTYTDPLNSGKGGSITVK